MGCRRLLANFIDFVDDNVIAMLMAATIGTFSGSLANLDVTAPAVFRLSIQLVLCFLVVSGIRLLCAKAYQRAAEGSKVRKVFGTLLPTLIWFLRVPIIVVFPDYFEIIYEVVGWDPMDSNTGAAAQALVLSIVLFLAFAAVLLVVARRVQFRSDANEPDSSWTTFYLQCGFLACLSATGKCMHFVVRVVVLTSLGPTDLSDGPTMEFGLVCGAIIVLLTLVCWCFLYSTIPNQQTNPRCSTGGWTQLHLSCQQYVMVYTWCFALVEYGWLMLYAGIGSATSHRAGLAVFCCWLIVHLAVAAALARRAPENSFYDVGRGGRTRATLCTMNFWCIDTITWWAWAQVMATLDTDVATMATLGQPGHATGESSWATVGVNLAVILALFFVTALIRVFKVAPQVKKPGPLPSPTDVDWDCDRDAAGEPGGQHDDADGNGEAEESEARQAACRLEAQPPAAAAREAVSQEGHAGEDHDAEELKDATTESCPEATARQVSSGQDAQPPAAAPHEAVSEEGLPGQSPVLLKAPAANQRPRRWRKDAKR